MLTARRGVGCALSLLGLFALLAQDVPDSARRVFSRGIIPVAEPVKEPELPAPPPLHLPQLLPAAEPAPIPVPAVSPPPSRVEPARDVRGAAQTAWLYFDQNYQPATGWFDSVKGYSYTTMWDLAGGLAAVACAEQLGVISPQRAGQLLGPSLRTLAQLRLYNAELPNREYNTATAAISGPQASLAKGTGWSALDLGRLLIWLKIVSAWHPEFAGLVREIVQRWKFTRLAHQEEMFGIYNGGAREFFRQEGRLGYEQYSASGYGLWSVPLKRARDYVETRPVQVLGVDLAADQRNLPFLTSEPFLLAAFELGEIDPRYTTLTRNLYRAQQRRWQTTGQLTAASEDSLDRAPWFAYFNIYYQGQSWQCRDHSGVPSPSSCGFSAKAAFGWASLFDDEYARLLDQEARTLSSSGGYVAGKYSGGRRNAALNINTNAVILEALLYRQRGRRAFLEEQP